jgi:hypothetical protein
VPKSHFEEEVKFDVLRCGTRSSGHERMYHRQAITLLAITPRIFVPRFYRAGRSVITSITQPPSSLTEERRSVTDGVRLTQRRPEVKLLATEVRAEGTKV